MKIKPPSASPPGSDTGAEHRDRIRFDEAAESPCASCPTAPCCTCLPLGKIRLESFTEVDHARFLLNFNGIELGLSRTGDWRAYFRIPCRFLDAGDASCRLHNAPAQPRICRHYNPYNCWYKRELSGISSDRHLRVDRRRMEALLPMLAFDHDGKLVDVPDWLTLADTFQELPPTEVPAKGIPAVEDPLDQAWREMALRDGETPAQPSLSYAELGDLCSGCGLHCCRALMIPHPVPAAASSLDFLRFVLGFPGLALGVADGGWHLIVRTACRHLADGRCAVSATRSGPSSAPTWTRGPALRGFAWASRVRKGSCG